MAEQVRKIRRILEGHNSMSFLHTSVGKGKGVDPNSGHGHQLVAADNLHQKVSTKSLRALNAKIPEGNSKEYNISHGKLTTNNPLSKEGQNTHYVALKYHIPESEINSYYGKKNVLGSRPTEITKAMVMPERAYNEVMEVIRSNPKEAATELRDTLFEGIIQKVSSHGMTTREMIQASGKDPENLSVNVTQHNIVAEVEHATAHSSNWRPEGIKTSALDHNPRLVLDLEAEEHSLSGNHNPDIAGDIAHLFESHSNIPRAHRDRIVEAREFFKSDAGRRLLDSAQIDGDRKVYGELMDEMGQAIWMHKDFNVVDRIKKNKILKRVLES